MKISLLLLAMGILLIFFLPEYPGAAPHPQNMSQVCFGNTCFDVELALTPEEQARGLMGRESLGQDKGILFVFGSEGVYPFWMKDTLIPLDMIWMDSEGRVVFIKEDAQPCGPVECPTINPGARARYVLEVSGGLAKEKGIKEGDRAILRIA